MPTRTLTLLVAALTAAWTAPAFALNPDEVIVVANSASAESVELANFYVAQRGIPKGNLFLVKTTAGYEISRAAYESQIRQPLLEFLSAGDRRGKTKAVCLVWGVPVRVAGGGVLGAFRGASGKAHNRLAMNYKFLGSVGLSFPAPRTEGLAPLGKLFDENFPPPTTPLLEIPKLLPEMEKLLESKVRQLAEIRGESDRRIAERQLVALVMDSFGLKGLSLFAARHKLPDIPADLPARLADAEKKLKNFTLKDPSAESVRDFLTLVDDFGGGAAVHAQAQREYARLEKFPDDASVDSELAMLWWGQYQLLGWLSNPLHWQVVAKIHGKKAPPVLMTCRIDGPTRDDAKRIVTDSLAAEKQGLRGRLYIDAGGMVPAYDKNLRALASDIEANSKIPVVLDEKSALFAPDSCPDAALYVGWYSLQKYIPAFRWVPGAVGWHIASFDAMHLRDPDSTEWCTKMIQNGVAATVGAVNEPYLASFPKPQEFFPLLMTGKYTLAECYWRTVPMVSWRLTLIGDPLYNPFRAAPQYDAGKLPAGLAP